MLNLMHFFRETFKKNQSLTVYQLNAFVLAKIRFKNAVFNGETHWTETALNESRSSKFSGKKRFQLLSCSEMLFTSFTSKTVPYLTEFWEVNDVLGPG